MKKVLFVALGMVALQSFAQDNFTYTPKQPKAGDEITIQYTQGGELAGIMKLPTAYALQYDSKGNKIIDIPLQREYGKLVGKIKTDTSASLLAFAFTIDDQFDKNNEDGFLIELYEGNQPKKSANANAAAFYTQYGPSYFGLKSNPTKAITYYEKAFADDSSSREKLLTSYLYAKRAADKEKGNAAIQAEIEKLFKAGLKAKEDYSKASSLYNMLGFRQQSAFISKLRSEKFPSGSEVTPMALYEKFSGKKSLAEKGEVYQEIVAVADTVQNNDEYKALINYLQGNLLNGYATAKDWKGFTHMAAKITDKAALAQAYNGVAWKMQESGDSLKYAEQLSSFATSYAKSEWQKPTGTKPNMLTSKQWADSRKRNYATYADTYAMVLYKLGNAKKGLPYAKDAAIVIGEGRNTDYNNTYALLAEKALSSSKLVPELEQFVKAGHGSEKIKEILKAQYIKSKKSDGGFDEYLVALEKEAYNSMLAELKKQIINKPASAFTLTDLDGKKVSLADYKGKVVILDFWATWCGPCVASFPGMKKMQEKFKDDPNVKFLFVDTWQTEENKEKNAKDFIAKNKYESFHVLMDNEDKVVSQFEISGIPTKFIIGGDGNIKFKSVGFNGEEHLYKELPAMIELAN